MHVLFQRCSAIHSCSNSLHIFKSLAPVSDSPGTGKGTAVLTFCAGGEGLRHFKKFLHKIRRRESYGS